MEKVRISIIFSWVNTFEFEIISYFYLSHFISDILVGQDNDLNQTVHSSNLSMNLIGKYAEINATHVFTWFALLFSCIFI